MAILFVARRAGRGAAPALGDGAEAKGNSDHEKPNAEGATKRPHRGKAMSSNGGLEKILWAHGHTYTLKPFSRNCLLLVFVVEAAGGFFSLRGCESLLPQTTLRYARPYASLATGQV